MQMKRLPVGLSATPVRLQWGQKNTIAILAENMGEPNKTFWELKQFNFWPCERRCGYRKVCESFSVAAKNRQNFVARDEL